MFSPRTTKWILIAGLVLAGLALAPAANAWTWPADGPVLRGFSVGSDKYAGGQHRGIDIALGDVRSVRAPATGEVTFAGAVPAHGLTVTISTSDGHKASLTHLGALLVKRGARVVEGDAIAEPGASGEPEQSVPYVHFGVRVGDGDAYIDPLSLLPSRGTPTSPPAPAAAPAQPSVAPPANASVPAPPSEASPAPSPAPLQPGASSAAASAESPSSAPSQANGAEGASAAGPVDESDAPRRAGGGLEIEPAIAAHRPKAAAARAPSGTAPSQAVLSARSETASSTPSARGARSSASRAGSTRARRHVVRARPRGADPHATRAPSAPRDVAGGSPTRDASSRVFTSGHGWATGRDTGSGTHRRSALVIELILAALVAAVLLSGMGGA